MPTLLIIDDHDYFRAFARATLEADGFTVVGEATNGEEGIAAAAALHPDVVLLDIVLPDIDGFRVCDRITAAGGSPDVVLTSSHDVRDFRQRVEHSRARGFVAKTDLSGAAVAALLG
jgi:two-component system, NarL family, nitrate/nitrite response regulator NarL